MKDENKKILKEMKEENQNILKNFFEGQNIENSRMLRVFAVLMGFKGNMDEVLKQTYK